MLALSPLHHFDIRGSDGIPAQREAGPTPSGFGSAPLWKGESTMTDLNLGLGSPG